MPFQPAHQSIWEKESFYRQRDVIIIGGGLSGLWAAYHLKKKKPSISVAILERGLIPSGASTRNAGFACFGSLTELKHDRDTMGDDQMISLVEMRYRGLSMLMELFKPVEIDFDLCGGYELITHSDDISHADLVEEMNILNRMLGGMAGTDTVFAMADHSMAAFGFGSLKHLIQNRYEGFLHSGKLCELLTQQVQQMGVTIFTGVNVNAQTKINDHINITTDAGIEFKATRVLICTNAFADSLIPGVDLVPARGQVLLTEPIPHLPWQGTFHAEQGYYYFRNLGNRILLGGARNTNFEGERTMDMTTSSNIQDALEKFLRTYIIPGRNVEISDRWSGIMAMGSDKHPIVREVSKDVFCAVRMSGMGVSLTPVTGAMAAD
ncbi:MAG: FAD-binding oxidoreductase, partial [Chitinophagaceae bacterium]